MLGLQASHKRSLQELLLAHKRVKVQINQIEQSDVEDSGQQLADLTGAQLLQVKGRTALFASQGTGRKVNSLSDASSAHGVHFLESATHATVTRLLAFLAIKMPQMRSPAVSLLWELIADVDEGEQARLAYLAPHFANVLSMLQVGVGVCPVHGR